MIKGDVAGHEFHGNQYQVGQTVRLEGKSADGKFEGSTDVKIINPHNNAAQIDRWEGKGSRARAYDKQGRQHIPTATVERPARGGSFPVPAKQFEAYLHTLHEVRKMKKTNDEAGALELIKASRMQPQQAAPDFLLRKGDVPGHEFHGNQYGGGGGGSNKSATEHAKAFKTWAVKNGGETPRNLREYVNQRKLGASMEHAIISELNVGSSKVTKVLTVT